jgi:membrane associated rhomboid family serine protease
MLRKKLFHIFFKSVVGVVGAVLVWRGIWVFLDIIDAQIFGGSHVWTAVGGVIVGLIMLYVLDDDLKEFERL